MKQKLLLLALATITPAAFASGFGRPAFVVDQCNGGVGVNTCTMKEAGSAGTGGSSSSGGKSQAELATAALAASGAGVAALLAEDKTSQLLVPKNVKGSYNSSVPGGNPFVFCSGGRPSRKNPLRKIYDMICPDGKVSPEQAAQKNGLTDHVNDARSLGGELAKIGTAGMIGMGISSAAKNTLGASTDSQGNSVNVNNNMSFNDYNRQVYNQIRQEDYLRQQENWKAAQDPEYIKQVIPDSNNFKTNQNIIAGQQAMIDNLNKEALAAANKLSSISDQPVFGPGGYAPTNVVTISGPQPGQNPSSYLSADGKSIIHGGIPIPVGDYSKNKVGSPAHIGTPIQSTQPTPTAIFNSHFR